MINNKIQLLHDLLVKPEFTKKIWIFFATPSAGEDYDSFENNYTYNNLSPLSIKGIVNQLSPSKLIYKQYGLDKQGLVEVITEAKYKNWFEKCNKIEIEGIEYEVFRNGTGGTLITDRSNSFIRVVLTRKKTTEREV